MIYNNNDFGSDSQEIEKEENLLQKENDNDLYIVVIGSSAGGIETLKDLLPNLPTGNIAYIIAQHLDPKHKSMLTELLKPHSKLKVVQIKDSQYIEPKTIYITPQNNNLIFKDDKLLLVKPTSQYGPKPSIDLIFRHIAERYKTKAIGIILSGTGTDGSDGIRAIKSMGGITIVQTETSAKFDGMPGSAIKTGNVDLILDIKDIGKAISDIISVENKKLVKERLDGKLFIELFDILQSVTGTDFSNYKEGTINRRINRRLSILNIDEFDAYVELLRRSKVEVSRLYRDLLISVTSFYRDKQAFISLGNAIEKYIDENKANSSRIRVWVPGCSTGEEAYTIAILIDQLLSKNKREYDIQIFGSDLDETAINIARQGKYTEGSLNNVDKSVLHKYFHEEREYYKVIQRIRDKVVFSRHDLISDPPFSHIDLISCRNVLIYFNSKLQEKLFPLFHYSLMHNGLLFLGKSEAIQYHSDLFDSLDTRHKIYQQKDVPSNLIIDLKRINPVKSIMTKKSNEKEKPFSLKDLLNNTIIEHFDFKALVIDKSYNLLYILGYVNEYMDITDGLFSTNILNLVKPNISTELRTLLHRTLKTRKTSKSRAIRIKKEKGHLSLHIHVLPIAEDDKDEINVLAIIFDEKRYSDIVPGNVEIEYDASDRIHELEHQLEINKDNLDSTLTDLETANQELQTLAEELQAANEELHSTNEELETSNEELQSTNEELTIVNEELQVRTTELQETNIDLENIQMLLGFAIILVDQDLRVSRYNELAKEFFEFSKIDKDEIITMIPCKLELPNLRDNINKVMNTNTICSDDFIFNDSYYIMKIIPYYRSEGYITGAIVTFQDLTYIKSIESNLRFANSRLKGIIEGTKDLICAFDHEYRYITYNTAYKEKVKNVYNKEIEIGLKIDVVLSEKPVYLYEIKKMWKRALDGEDFKVQRELVDLSGAKYFYETTYSTIYDENGELLGAAQISRDVTEFNTLAENLKVAYHRLNSVIESTNDIIAAIDKQYNYIFYNSSYKKVMERFTDKKLTEKANLIEYLKDMPAKLVDPILDNWKRSLKGERFTIIVNMNQSLGENRDFEINYNPIRSENGDILGSALFGRDITERKKAQKELMDKQTQLAHAGRLASLGEMAAGVAHELNQPLSIINTQAEFIKLMSQKGQTADRKFIETIDSIIEEVERAANIINHMRGFARNDIRALELSNIINSVEASQVFFLAQFKQHNIEFTTVYEDDVPPVMIEPQRFEQIVINFLSNSRYAVDKKAISINDPEYQKKITIKVYYNKDKNAVIFEVYDNGIGMDGMEKDRCLEPFFTTKDVGEGTGLGLSIVHSIIKDFNGFLEIESEKGKYTIIRVGIPVEN